MAPEMGRPVFGCIFLSLTGLSQLRWEHIVSKTSPFLFSWYLSQIPCGFANIWQT